MEQQLSHLHLERRKLILQSSYITQGVNPAISITSSSNSTLSLSTAYSSPDGLSTANGRLTRQTFRLDMMRILGDWFGKYEKFSIRLVVLNCENHNLYTANAYCRWANLWLSGFNWHQNFDPFLGSTNARKLCYSGEQQGATANKNFTYFSNSGTPRMVFYLANGERFVDATLEWTMIEDGPAPKFPTAANNSYTYPLCNFVFEILPCVDDKPKAANNQYFFIN